MNGVLIINKPKDFTSFDVVAVVRKLSRQKKIGHTGTLDPMATGVLPMLLGNATKAQPLLPDGNKEYIADFKLGITTDTLDITGTVLTQNTVNVTEQQLLTVMENYNGDIMQLPPMYSAVQKNGQRLYDLARKGIEVERDLRPITIYKLQLLEYNKETATGKLIVACSKGTYIRSLIDDIGRDLKCGGVLTALNRTQACGYSIDNAITLEQVKALAENGSLETSLLPTESIFYQFQELYVTAPQSIRFANGGELDIKRTSLNGKADNNQIVRVKSPEKQFLGLGIVDIEQELLKIHKIFNQ